MTRTDFLFRSGRVGIAAGLALAAAAISYWFWHPPKQPYPSDFADVWMAARAFREGLNPYVAVGPGGAYEYPMPFFYPLPMVLVALPFSYLPIAVADPLFVGLGAFLFTWAVTRRTPTAPALLAFVSIGMITAIQESQWSPLLVGAVLMPWFGFLLCAKPTIGGALWLAYPSTLALALSCWLTAFSISLAPNWIADWLHNLQMASHFRAPIQYWGGPLVLFGLLRWKLPEARLLVAAACVPQSPQLYEAVPLFLIPRSIEEAWILVFGSLAVWIGRSILGNDYYSQMFWTGQLMLVCLYFPCLYMVWKRPPATVTELLPTFHRESV